MANRHSTKKAQFNMRIKHELFVCMEKKADELGVTLEEACARAFVSFCKEG